MFSVIEAVALVALGMLFLSPVDMVTEESKDSGTLSFLLVRGGGTGLSSEGLVNDGLGPTVGGELGRVAHSGLLAQDGLGGTDGLVAGLGGILGFLKVTGSSWFECSESDWS